LRVKVENIATPFTAMTDAVPDKTALLGFAPIATVTTFTAVDTTVPVVSRIATWIGGLRTPPPLPPVG